MTEPTQQPDLGAPAAIFLRVTTVLAAFVVLGFAIWLADHYRSPYDVAAITFLSTLYVLFAGVAFTLAGIRDALERQAEFAERLREGNGEVEASIPGR